MGNAVPGRPPLPMPRSTTASCTLNFINKQPSHYIGQDSAPSAVPSSGTCSATRSKPAPRACQLPSSSACEVSYPEPSLPFSDEDTYPSQACTMQAAAPLLKTNSLKDMCVALPGGKSFIDKVLPPQEGQFQVNQKYPSAYFCALHQLVNSAGNHYPEGTPNHLGARIPLHHTGLNLDMWRKHLIGYESPEIAQYLEFGFPIGLQQDPPPVLEASYRNHGSSYQYFKWIDEFIETGLEFCDVTGPLVESPFTSLNTSPLMTAVKKPGGRRAVFDASFGDFSINNNTPSDNYLGMPIEYAYPKIEDFKRLVLKCGVGCYIYKRNLSRYFLQIPLDPIEYPKVGFVWRGFLFFFCGFMFGLKHAGLQGQKVTTAVTWIHNRLGLQTDQEEMFHSINYSDDIGGCEASEERAFKAYVALTNLFDELGLRESKSKAHPPSTCMPYLGVEFDTVSMVMRVPADKVEELRSELNTWERKTTATKKGLQQLLGRLFWVSRCIRFSRGFMSRLLTQLKSMHTLPDQKKAPLSEDCKEDIKWWSRYIRRFNGTEMIYNSDPIDLTLDQLLDSSAIVNCGDAQPMGGGSYCGEEYWSRPFPRWLQDPQIPIHLKEFYVVLVSAWLWGDRWRGKLVYIFCDNTAVVESLQKEKPKDPKLQELLREFLFIVCTRGFTPVFRVIGTVANETADFISRVHDPVRTKKYFLTKGLPARKLVTAPDSLFLLRSNW